MSIKVCANWLPSTLPLTAEVARRAESAGLWGIGIGDSPRYAELYSACAVALGATESLRVTTCVTNPVTRHWSVHASAMRGLGGAHPGRFRLGVGRGDSAVHTFGDKHASLGEMSQFLDELRTVADVPLLVAASGPRTAEIAGRHADGIIAGVGRRTHDIARIADSAASVRDASSVLEVWATIRVAIAADDAETDVLRRRLIPRAISASHFAFASTLTDKRVPAEFAEVLAERYARYDYGSHGSSGATSNAALFSDRPDIEQYLLDRFAIVGTADHCRRELAGLVGVVDGVFCSLLFEDALEQIDRIGAILPV